MRSSKRALISAKVSVSIELLHDSCETHGLAKMPQSYAKRERASTRATSLMRRRNLFRVWAFPVFLEVTISRRIVSRIFGVIRTSNSAVCKTRRAVVKKRCNSCLVHAACDTGGIFGAVIVIQRDVFFPWHGGG